MKRKFNQVSNWLHKPQLWVGIVAVLFIWSCTNKQDVSKIDPEKFIKGNAAQIDTTAKQGKTLVKSDSGFNLFADLESGIPVDYYAETPDGKPLITVIYQKKKPTGPTGPTGPIFCFVCVVFSDGQIFCTPTPCPKEPTGPTRQPPIITAKGTKIITINEDTPTVNN